MTTAAMPMTIPRIVKKLLGLWVITAVQAAANGFNIVFIIFFELM
jgi:hypothetical protein